MLERSHDRRSDTFVGVFPLLTRWEPSTWGALGIFLQFCSMISGDVFFFFFGEEKARVNKEQMTRNKRKKKERREMIERRERRREVLVVFCGGGHDHNVLFLYPQHRIRAASGVHFLPLR